MEDITVEMEWKLTGPEDKVKLLVEMAHALLDLPYFRETIDCTSICGPLDFTLTGDEVEVLE